MRKNLYEGGNFGQEEIERLKAMGGFPFEVSSQLLGEDLKDEIVLDVGVGSHTALGEFVTGQGGRYMAKDISLKMLEAHANEDYADWRIAGDIARMPIKDNAVDITHARLVLMHLDPEKRKKAIGEMIRVASDTAVFIEPDWSSFEGSETINNLRDLAIEILGDKMDLYYGATMENEINAFIKENDLQFNVEKKVFARDKGEYYNEIFAIIGALKEMAEKSEDEDKLHKLEDLENKIKQEAEEAPEGFIPPDLHSVEVFKK